MDMSPACTPPVHAAITAADQMHPRYGDYLTYRAAMSRQLVTCCSFDSWLRGVEEFENGRRIVFEVTSPHAALALGWYVNVFAPRKTMPRRFGPFASRVETEAA